jgi:hypothetical protein
VVNCSEECGVHLVCILQVCAPSIEFSRIW